MNSDSLITIPQLAKETHLPISWLYERSRRDELPGMRRAGKYVRVDRDEFFAALKAGKIR
jgi:predicted DNA-binding transcriptional regulator AlpA